MAERVTAAVAYKGLDRALVEERFRALLEQNAGALRRLASSYTRSPTDRDDLIQDIAVGLWQALPGFRGECSDRTFLFRIAQNRCLARLARRRQHIALDEEQMDVPDPQPTVESRISEEQQRDHLMEAVRRLPLRYRQVITLMLEGLSYREIAQVLGIGESNVGVRLNRARQLLKSDLERRP